MDTKQNDMTPHAAAEALRWLAEMGADEIIGESPVNRLAAPAAKPVATPAAAPAAAPVAVTPGAPAAQCRSLAEIAAALEGFDACPLKKTATRLCYADGNPEARVMLVGEAPGRDEDIQGKPFVGRSGQLLTRMLAAIGLERGDVYICNVIKCRPPQNRDPMPDEVATCSPFLHRQLAAIGPRVILTLGRFAAINILGREGSMGDLRRDTGSFRGTPVVATYHPSYLLRTPIAKRAAWDDLLRVRTLLDAPA